MSIRMVGMTLLMLLGLAAIHFYIGWHFYLFLSQWLPNLSYAAFWIPFSLIAFGYLFGRVPGPKVLFPLYRLLKVVGSYYFAVLEFAVLLLPLADLLYWILKKSGVVPVKDFIIGEGWAVILVMAALLIWGSYNAWSTVIRNYPISITKKSAFSNIKVVVASDIHLGNIVGNRHLKRMVDRMNEMEPDFILLPGDVIDDSIEPFLRNEMSQTLKQLKAKHGVFAVLGNHEYYGGHIEQYVEEMKKIGIRVLRDEVVQVDGSLYIAGRKDKTAEAMDPEKRKSVMELLKGRDSSLPVIMMDHQPYGFAAAAEAGVDLLLCGHTHRGQFAPNHWLTGRLFELDWGYMQKEHMHVAVSSGYGTWGPPIRLASRSEILEIDMTFENEG
ncbi:metallophosphoesterase [Falsibacillus albus]|uniref:Metallophosphoesterase n=1 Tax=Falsibacillus albus TaxID=2478915 RepID=A0A3L7JSJ8_9BACI|nr:metallophosphoesterase [Falsibacillus albus]RLQ93828.1 metallophosphoesterase [Falsibacillus albus]